MFVYAPDGNSGGGAAGYTSLPIWTIEGGQVRFGAQRASGCITPGRVSGVTYIIHVSNWQCRSDAGSAWSGRLMGNKHVPDPPTVYRPPVPCTGDGPAPAQDVTAERDFEPGERAGQSGVVPSTRPSGFPRTVSGSAGEHR